MTQITMPTVKQDTDVELEAADRVFVCCPADGGTEKICALLHDHSVHCIAAADPRQLVREIDSGVSAVVLNEEVLRDSSARKILAAVIEDEPEWSDLPVVALLGADAIRELSRNGYLFSLNLRVVEMPARPEGITGAVLNAVRSRKRQYRVRDFIAERVKAEEKLGRLHKLESIGILAEGVAHDFNNLLTLILGNASMAFERLWPGDGARQFIGEVIDASERAAYLTRQLLAYVGQSVFTLGHVEISRLVQDLVPAIETSLGNGVEIRFELSDDLPPILGDYSQMRQVVMNLVTNAAEAIPEGERGEVIVSTRLNRLDQAYIQRSFSAEEPISPGSYVCLEVRDSGIGMKPEVLERIFDPFFTTKFIGRGLGLAAVTGIVRGHKGALKVWSKPDQGSAFTVLFPAESAASTYEMDPVVDRKNSSNGIPEGAYSLTGTQRSVGQSGVPQSHFGGVYGEQNPWDLSNIQSEIEMILSNEYKKAAL